MKKPLSFRKCTERRRPNSKRRNNEEVKETVDLEEQQRLKEETEKAIIIQRNFRQKKNKNL